MRRLELLAVLLGILLISSHLGAASEDYEEDEEAEGDSEVDDEEKDVVVLTDSNFDDLLAGKKFALVEFYAPWCGHCKSLKPEYARAATVLKGVDSENLILAKVDATAETALAQKYEVKGYPSIKFFVDGEPSEYNGGRTSDEIVRWVKKKVGPPAVTIEEDSQLSSLLDGEDAFFFGYFEDFAGDKFEDFEDVARSLEDVESFCTKSADVAAELNLSNPGFVVARKSFGEWEFVPSSDNAAFKTDADFKTQLGEFAKAESVSGYLRYSQKTHQKIFGGPMDLYVFLFVPSAQVATVETELLKPVVPLVKSDAFAVTIDMDDTDTSGIVNYFIGAEKPEGVAVMAWSKGGSKKYKGPTDVTKDSFEKFVLSVIDGTAEPFYKSEDIPEVATDADGITKVVGKSFEDVVMDPEKDVLLEIYAPWCGHCKSLLPIYKKLGKRFKKVDSVVIAQFDGTANEHPALKFEGFPTILFFPAGEDKKGVPFEGGRTLKDFTKYLKKNAKVPFQLSKKSKKEEDSDAKDEL